MECLVPVFQLLYTSGATRNITPDDIASILTVSRRNNAKVGVTGMLLYADGVFIQVLEGARRDVRHLADRISADDRHRNFMVLHENEAESRAFAEWQMGYRDLNAASVEGGSLFRLTRDALEERISSADGGMMLDLVIAFAGPAFMRKTG